MKTTVEIPDALLEAAKRHAAERGTTLRSLVEAGLRSVLEERGIARGFELRDTSVPGRGVRSEIREGGWERTFDLIYEGRGA